MKPSVELVIKNKSFSPIKLPKDEDMSEEKRRMMKEMHTLANEALPQIWNQALNVFRDMQGITGDDALSALTTLMVSIAAPWVTNMMRIANADDTGRTKEELLDYIVQGCKHALGVK